MADLAMAEASDIVAAAYGGEAPAFGPENLIPKPFDPRLILQVAPAVARAAMESGVATRPIADFDAYRQRLSQFVFRSGLAMTPVFARAKTDPKRVVYAEGEEERVLRAAQAVLDEGLAKPILIGRSEVVETRLRTPRPAHEAGQRLRARQSAVRSALSASTGSSITRSWSGAASRRISPAPWCAPATR